MNTGIEKVIKEGNGNTIIYTALLAAAIANTLPTPFDGIYFARQQSLKEKLEKGEISIENYWWHDVGEYYLWTSLWYGALFGGIYALSGTYKNNVKILMGTIGAGIVVGVALKNIQKDKEIANLQKSVGSKQNTGNANSTIGAEELKAILSMPEVQNKIKSMRKLNTQPK